MPRPAPLPADSSPVLICCSRREAASTPLSGPCAIVWSKPWCRVVGVQRTRLAVSATQAAFILRSCLAQSGRNRRSKNCEDGPGMGHLLTESCSNVHFLVCRCRAGNEDCCCSMGSPCQTINLFLLLSDDRSVAGGVAAAGVAAAGCRCCSRR